MSVNGCGPGWIPAAVTSLLFDWFFEADCDKHDEGYEEGGDEARRKVCDDKFFAAMKRDTLRHRGAARLVRWVQAGSYYGVVRLFGWALFNYTDKDGETG